MSLEDLARDGDRLTEAAIQWGRRPPSAPIVSLTSRDLRIFAWLEQHRFATSGVIAALFWGRHGTPVQERMKLLHDAGYVDKFRPNLGHTGSAKWIYRLTQRGWDVLCDRGLSATGRLPFGELTDLAYVGHDLQLDAMLVSMMRDAFPGAGPLADRLPFEWQGPDLGRVPADGGPVAPLGAAARLPEGHFIAVANSIPGVLEPDATLLGHHAASGLPVAVMLEYDRTRRPAKQRDRWRRYDRFLAETWRDSRFADHHGAPIVLYLVADTKQIPAFIKEADKHLTAWIGPRVGTPQQGVYPGRDLVLFTSRERLLAGDWTVDCVPAQPADVRGTKAVHPRTQQAPFLRLFATADAVGAIAA
jgi:hypothetical protein